VWWGECGGVSELGYCAEGNSVAQSPCWQLLGSMVLIIVAALAAPGLQQSSIKESRDVAQHAQQVRRCCTFYCDTLQP
jgi:hypothetical protein